MTAPLPPLTDEVFDLRDHQVQVALHVGDRHAWLLVAEQLRDDAFWHRDEVKRLQDAYFVDQTIAPDGELRPTISKLVKRAGEAEAEIKRLRVELTWYGDAKNYEQTAVELSASFTFKEGFGPLRGPFAIAPIGDDKGKRARTALAPDGKGIG